PRHFLMPDQVSSWAGWQAMLAAAAAVFSAEFATKLLILGSLFLAALGAYRALPIGGLAARGSAATIFAVNPFIYGRIHYGQLAVVAGYSILPWFSIALRRLARKPEALSLGLVALSLTVIGVVDLHFLLP